MFGLLFAFAGKGFAGDRSQTKGVRSSANRIIF
jgi:hypothetical protein